MIINFIILHRIKSAWFLLFVLYGDLLAMAYVKKASESSGIYRYNVPSNFNKHNQVGNNVTNKPPIISKTLNERKPQRKSRKFIGGPGQPEMQAFQSVNANNMVDLFSGDFSYNVPLMDVGGYPIGLSYRSGVTMDQEASWVGLGWNINPGTISRNVRGLPDDFDGTEKITKQYNIRKNWTAGINASLHPELFGIEIPKLSANVGAFYNNYSGIGFEVSAGATINPGKFMTTSETTDEKTQETKIDTSRTTKNVGGSLNFSLNSQQGLNIDASLMMKYGKEDSKINGIGTLSSSYNSRAGLQDLQLSAQAFTTKQTERNGQNYDIQSVQTPFVNISFAKPSYTPTITMPMSHYGFALTLKGGGELFGFHPLGALKGYYSQQFISKNDRVISLPAYGYMYYNKANNNDEALLDFNREKDIPFRTQTPHVAIPNYTYDTYSISGEGIGGSFRPYRGDVGYIRDHLVRTKNGNGGVGIDLGAGPNLFHVGGNLQLTYATVTSNSWRVNNFMERRVRFNENDSAYEAVYFRNPGEQTTNTQDYYDKIGGDDVVRIGLSGSNLEPVATTVLKKYDKQKLTGTVAVNSPIIKSKRDKRSQVISYLTAQEAQQVGLDTIIKSYPVNVFPKGKCDSNFIIIPRNDGSGGIRKPNHLSEITVLNNDGRRYVYGIPAYNLGQKEVTFAVDKTNANPSTGLVSYTPASENSVDNDKGKDNFFSSDSTPAYAHSFLLTSLLSPDYIDITGDGVTEDDNGDAVKFNYSRMSWTVSGQSTTHFKWRAPYDENKASYNEGLKTDKTDDKGNYVYGEKEVWYLNSIESKTMVATFVLDLSATRYDDYGVANENGGRDNNFSLKRLKEINLYSKADYYKNPSKARPIKTVHFGYSYNLCKGSASSYDAEHGKLTLDSVWFTYNGNSRGAKSKYKFAYHSNNPTYNNKSYDRWGNYKPDSDNPNSVPNADYPYVTQDKTKADDNVAAWNLYQVKLPSGAKINVTYEADDYGYVQDKRAMNMLKIAGMATDSILSHADKHLYENANRDNNYLFINVPQSVSSKQDIYQKYLQGVDKLYLKMMVKMPSDVLGSGYEAIPFYAEYESYGTTDNANKIWIKLKPFGVDQTYPAVAALQYLRLNLPSKAYPGSDLNGDASFRSVVQSILGMGVQFKDAVIGFNLSKRKAKVCQIFDSTKSYIRLNNPNYIKYGGGLRVKKVVISDNWYNMTGQKESYYGQQYDYSDSKEIFYDSSGVRKSKTIKISSGVATYEPNIGNEENPLRQPIEFQESVTMAPSDYLYSEYPYCESFFPSASVGYSKVKVSSINKRNLKSFNGWEETEFYTSKDFPTVTDYTTFDGESRKRGKRKFNFINSLSMRRVTLSQGFKVELNDMNGRMKAQKSYAANDSLHPIAYTINYFKTETDNVHGTRLSNTIPVMDSANGKINPFGIVGKDIELMMDFREQHSLSTGVDMNANVEIFTVFIFPVTIPAFFPRFNIDDNRFRSAVTLKVLQRYGILDSVVHYEKGSLVSTKNMVYDAETGEVLLSRTQNEFNDPIYSFNYPAHWKYSGMEPAYKNIGAVFSGLNLDNGHITNTDKNIDKWLESGDEVMVVKTDTAAGSCSSIDIARRAFSAKRLWVIDTNKIYGTAGRSLYLMDRFGNPYSSNNVTIKIIRSGKRNVASASIGSVTSLRDPIDRSNPSLWLLKMDSTIGVIATGAGIFKDVWKVDNRYVSEYGSDTIHRTDNLVMYATKTGLTRHYTFDNNQTDGQVPTLINSNFFTAALYEAGRRADCGNVVSKRYLSRGILVFDSIYKIPANAVINSAGLELQRIPPRNMWENEMPVCYWDTLTTAQSLYSSAPTNNDGTLWRLVNGTILQRITQPWTSRTRFDDYNTIATSLHQTTVASSTTVCQNYDQDCKDLVQDMVSYPSYNYGFLMKLSTEVVNLPPPKKTVNVSHMSFYSKLGGTPSFYNCGVSKSFSPTLTVNYSYSTVSYKDTCVSVFSRRLNPYVQGIWGNWRMEKSYTFYDSRKDSVADAATDIRRNGEFRKFVPFWYFGTPQLSNSNYGRWVWNSEITQFNKRGLETENKDPLGRYNSGLYGYNQTLPIAVAQNAKYRQIAFDGFEDYFFKNDSCDQRCPPARHFDFSFYKNKIDTIEKHTGKSSLKLSYGETDSLMITIVSSSTDSIRGQLTANAHSSCVDSITTNNSMITSVFSPIQGDSMILSAWVKENKDCKCGDYTHNEIQLIYSGLSGIIGSPVVLHPSGNIIDGWQRYENKIKIPSTATSLKMKLKNTFLSDTAVYFDDIRLHPFNSNMKTFVYHPINLRLMSELDENNYASFYEYDDEGTLIRVKKETQKGIKTIQETHSALLKQ